MRDMSGMMERTHTQPECAVRYLNVEVGLCPHDGRTNRGLTQHSDGRSQTITMRPRATRFAAVRTRIYQSRQSLDDYGYVARPTSERVGKLRRAGYEAHKRPLEPSGGLGVAHKSWRGSSL